MRVMLVEAGPDFRSVDAPAEMRSPNPAHILQDQFKNRFQWPGLIARRAAVQPYLPLWRGKGVGGCSSINGHIVMRPPMDDFDRWSELGCDGWGSTDMAPVFERLEADPDAPRAAGRHGPVPIYRAPFDQWGAVDRALHDASWDLGFGSSQRDGGADGAGLMQYAATSVNGRRVTTNDAYLEPARGRPNLSIRGHLLVDQIEFSNRAARSVRCLGPNGPVSFACRQVVLCAGAVHTPAILQRSGVGDGNQLKQLGCDVVHHAPAVGQNLMDHPLASLVLTLNADGRARDVHQRYTNCCVRYSSGIAGTATNDMFILNLNLFGADESGLSIGMLGVSVFQSLSRGTLAIVNRDPEVEPNIDLRLLSDPTDLARMRDGVGHLLRLAKHGAFQRISDNIVAGLTARSLSELTTKDAIDSWLLSECMDAQHLGGTCRMGNKADTGVVVDPAGRVIGVDGVRVADASIFPEIPRANTYLTCVAIGERMADIIASAS